MTGKNKGNWPYHEDPHGNWVACSSNPCKLHSGGDIMATSPEDAFAKAHADDNAGGMTSSAEDPSKLIHWNREGNREPIFGEFQRNAHRMVTDDKVKGILRNPVTNVVDRGNEFFEGGRYQETKDMSQEEVAKLISSDVDNLKKVGIVPSDWRVKVESGAEKFRISVHESGSKTKMLRSITPGDITHDERDGGDRYLRQAYVKATGDKTYSKEGARLYCANHSDMTEGTTEMDDAAHYIEAAAAQYAHKIHTGRDFDTSERSSEVTYIR